MKELLKDLNEVTSELEDKKLYSLAQQTHSIFIKIATKLCSKCNKICECGGMKDGVCDCCRE